MAEHTLAFMRSDGHLENHQEFPNKTHPEYVEVKIRGWVGTTYQFLRIDPDVYEDDHLAAWDPDLGSWEIISDALADQGLREGHVFSDITIIDDFGDEDEDPDPNLQTVTFRWDPKNGPCYDCGLPAAFVAPKRYGEYNRNKIEARLCAVCAANEAAQGEPIERIDKDDD